MNERLKTSSPLDVTAVCSAPRPTSRLTITLHRSVSTQRGIVTPTTLNGVTSTVHNHSTSRSVAVTATRPATNAASEATSHQVIIAWNFVIYNNIILYNTVTDS